MKNTLLTISFILYTIIASATPFITRWDLSKTGSGANQISFNAVTTGAVNYTWETVPLSSNNGSGTLTNFTTTITGLPTNAIIRLKIDSANLSLINANTWDKKRLIDVEQWGTINWTSMNHAFDGCLNLNISATDVPNLSIVTDMSYMFSGCKILNSPNNMNTWNTTNIIDMYHMFYADSSFNQPIGNWNTSNVIDMAEMFCYAGQFNQPIGNWNTSKVINMAGLFAYDTSFNQPVGNWNTSKDTNMAGMFLSATSFNQPIGNWNTSNVTDMSYMFEYATSFNQPIGNWNTDKVIYMDELFRSASSFNQPIDNWNTSNLISIQSMFYSATSFNQPLGNWNISKISDRSALFYKATSFNQPLGNWNLSHVRNIYSMLDSSGMDCHNYAATLQGWANNTATPNNLILGAANIHYGTNVVADRNTLINTKGWDIIRDIADATACNATGITSTTPINIFTLSPNPTQGTLNINCSQAGTFTLYNMLGQSVYSTTLLGNNTQETKTLPSLPASIYNYILTAQNGERVVGKLEVE